MARTRLRLPMLPQRAVGLPVAERPRMQQQPSGDWEDFARRNADLLAWRPSLLDHYYHPETLSSPLARSVFLLPDKVYEALR